METSQAKKIFKEIISDWEIENYDFFTSHFSEEYWITIKEEFECVDCIEIGVPFLNENEYDWPKA